MASRRVAPSIPEIPAQPLVRRLPQHSAPQADKTLPFILLIPFQLFRLRQYVAESMLMQVYSISMAHKDTDKGVHYHLCMGGRLSKAVG